MPIDSHLVRLITVAVLMSLLPASSVGAPTGVGQRSPSAVATPPARVSEPLQRARDYAAREVPPKKVVGGLPASAGDDPWQVALLDGTVSEPHRMAFCGGSIIADHWILTAAHCVDEGTIATDVNVLAGTVDLASGGVRRTVDQIIIRGDYGAGYTNDVALLHLSEGVTQAKIDLIADTEVNPVKALPLRVTGWGAKRMDGPMVRELLWTNVSYFQRDYCQSRAGYAGVTNAMLCAGLKEGNADACQGDSGGPLSAKIAGRPVLVGVVSWGIGCGLAERPGVYARVASFVPWIRSCIRGDICY